ncbi:translation initiation factor IF3 [Aspergillus sclerotiicarbonarius CBS 121057]|uniref:Translation initiation factor IF3 n=1 Tax=Aspergillus sclerotiicarbonarius (strain CBS 121057 / IBT 28362) TaxID=1448318 RepID=A0A319ELW5_ASPSB|nr:translation initiation factor IF3 [Aspergillus sclerotiicarbonarius CBS 121057]
MKHMRRLVPPTRALRQILPTPQPTFRPEFFRFGPRINNIPSRSYSPTSSLLRYYRAKSNPRALPQYTLDEDIGAQFVQLVNETNSLDPPASLREILRSINRADDCLQQVSAGENGVPICKIVNKFELREQAKEKAKAPRDGLKQLELNWAIDSHDLSHRMKQLTTFLEKGRKVEVVLTKKKRKRSPTVEEVKTLMDRVMDTVREAKAVPVKPMEGEPGRHVVLVVKKEN